MSRVAAVRLAGAAVILAALALAVFGLVDASAFALVLLAGIVGCLYDPQT